MPKNRQNKSNRKDNATRPQRSRSGRDRHLSIRSELRREPDVGKIARAVVALAIAQAEQEAAAQQEEIKTRPPSKDSADE